MSPLTPREYFNLIDHAADVPQKRLLIPEGSSERSKGQEIMAARNRLYLAIIEKYPEGVKVTDKYSNPSLQIKKTELIKIDLTTIDKILDAKISIWESEIEPSIEQGIESNGRRAGYSRQISLRQALNISRYNPFNFTGKWGPLWGKSSALEEVEKKLGINQVIQKA